VADDLVHLPQFLRIVLINHDEWRNKRQDKVQWLGGTHQGSILIIPTELCKELKQYIVIKSDFNHLIVLVCATKNSNYKVKHQDCVNE
jgi:hypothetical protein